MRMKNLGGPHKNTDMILWLITSINSLGSVYPLECTSVFISCYALPVSSRLLYSLGTCSVSVQIMDGFSILKASERYFTMSLCVTALFLMRLPVGGEYHSKFECIKRNAVHV